MSAAGAQDHFAHSSAATSNRARKATALAATAARLGFQPYELAIVGGTIADADRRRQTWKSTPGVDRAPSVESWQAALVELEKLVWALPGPSTCDACGWAVRAVTTASGKRIDLDPLVRQDGTVYAEPPARTGGRPVAVVLAGHQTAPEGAQLYRQHSRSCPARSDKATREAPRCPVCSRPLDAVLAARQSTYTTHPCCDATGGST